MKQKLKKLWDWVKTNPIFTLILILIFALVMFFSTSYLSDASVSLGNWWYDRKDEQLKQGVEKNEQKSVENESNANIYATQANNESQNLQKSKENLKKHKEHLDEIYKKPTPKPLDPRKYDSDDNVPSAEDSCTRAISLGVPCDPKKFQ